jgi:hypothetical protein
LVCAEYDAAIVSSCRVCSAARRRAVRGLVGLADAPVEDVVPAEHPATSARIPAQEATAVARTRQPAKGKESPLMAGG